MHYKFRYEEIYARHVDVEASNGLDARKRFEEAVRNNEIKIDKDKSFRVKNSEFCGEAFEKFRYCDDYFKAEPSELNN